MKKRLVSFIMTVAMLCGFTGWLPKEFEGFSITASAVSKSSVVDQLNSYINQYNGTTASSSQMYMGSQCKGFANWIFKNIFGVYIGAYPESANYTISNPQAETVGTISPGSLTESTSKELLQKAMPGDYLQVQRSIAKSGGKCGPHSMIIVSVAADGVYVFDCNSDGNNTIKYYLYTWSKFDYDNRGMSLYHSWNYEPGPIPPTDAYISLNKTEFAIGENIEISVGAKNATKYTIGIDETGIRRLITRDIPQKYTLSTKELGVGSNYSIYVTASNSAGYCDSKWIHFSIVAVPTFSTISANKFNYTLGENIVFTANSDNNAKFTIGINDEDGKRLITRDLPGTLTVSSNELGLGTYYAYVTAYNSAGYVDSSGIWFLVSPKGAPMTIGAGQTIPNGDYVIVSEMNQDLYLDIPGNTIPAENNLVVNIYNGHPGKGAECDAWTVTYLNNGFYKITQKDTKMALDLYDASLNRGTRTTVRAYTGAASQQWSINTTKHGYQIQSRSSGWVLDVVGGNANPGTQTNVWEINDNKAQSWGFVPFASDNRPIPDGEYYIKSALADVWLDAWGNNDDKPFTNGTNIGILDAKSEKFKVEYVAEGYYRITEVNSGLVLDLANGTVDSYLCIGNNIHLWTGGEKTQRNQLWRIKDEGNGYYTLISKLSGYCIDVQNSVMDNSTNVIQCFYNKSNAQKWSFEKVHKHTVTATAAKDATCTANGNTAYWYCSGCKKYFSDSACTKEITLASTVIKATDHNTTATAAEVATCTTDGNTAYWYCSNCKKYFSDSACTKEITLANTVIKATGHKWGSTTYTWSADDKTCTATRVCENDSTHNESETVNSTYSVTKDPTCDVKGIGTYTATFKNTAFAKQTKNVDVAAKGHNWNAAIYTWSADNKICTAIRICANDSTHVETEIVSTTYSVTKQPTYVEAGIGTYTATFKNTAFVKQTINIYIPPLSNNNYPVVTSEVSGRQFRLKWTAVKGAEKYGIALYQSGKWRVKAQFAKNVTTFTSSKMKTGSYRMVVCAKVNGEWDTSSLSKRAFTIKIA